MGQFKESDIEWITTDNGEDEGKTENIMFSWGINGFGWGTTTFYYQEGKLYCDNETMSKDQIKMLMNKFVDNAEFIS